MHGDKINKVIKNLEDATEAAKEELMKYYTGLSKDKLIEEMRELDDKSLLWICNGMALQSEAYEICGAAQIVKAERGLE